MSELFPSCTEHWMKDCVHREPLWNSPHLIWEPCFKKL